MILAKLANYGDEKNPAMIITNQHFNISYLTWK